MSHSRSLVIQCVVVWLGTILQFIGLFTPGWRIVSSVSGYSSSDGLWFYRDCDNEDECETISYLDHHKDIMAINPTSHQAMTYASQVGDQVTGLLSLLFCIIASMLLLCDEAPRRPIAVVSSSLLLVGGTMVWTLVGYKLAVLAAEARSLEENSPYTIGFPYSLFLSAFGSFLTICVALVNLKSLSRNFICDG